MPRGSPNEPIREDLRLRRLPLRGAPLIDVVAVNAETEEIGRYKSGLFGLNPDVTDDEAVGGGYYPTLPVTLANQDRGTDRKNTRNVIKAHEDGFIQFMISSFFGEGESGVCRRTSIPAKC